MSSTSPDSYSHPYLSSPPLLYMPPPSPQNPTISYPAVPPLNPKSPPLLPKKPRSPPTPILPVFTPPPPVHPITPPPSHGPAVHPPPPQGPILYPPPPSHIVPPPSPPSDNHHVIVIVFVSLGGFFFLAFLAAALCCWVKKKKKVIEETDVVDIEDHIRVQEVIVPGPHGEQMVIRTVDEDVQIHEEVDKIEKVLGDKGSCSTPPEGHHHVRATGSHSGHNQQLIEHKEG